MLALTLLLAAAAAGALVGRIWQRSPQRGMFVGWRVPFALRSIERDPRTREPVPAPSNSTGDPEFDAHFRIQPMGASAPAYLDRLTRRTLLSWIDRAPIVLEDDRIEVAGGRPTVAEFARLSVALAGPRKGRLTQIIGDASEPLALRRWAYDALPLVAGELKAQDFARSFEDREPVLLFRTAVLLDDTECLRELATGPSTAVAVEAMAELASRPGEANGDVVIHALADGSDERVVAAVPLARSSGLDAAALIGAAGRLRGDRAREALCVVLGELGDSAATDFLVDALGREGISRTRLAALDALAECARLESLEGLRAVVRTFDGAERQRGDRAIARIVERARNFAGGLTFPAVDGGELALEPDTGRLSPAEGSPAPRD